MRRGDDSQTSAIRRQEVAVGGFSLSLAQLSPAARNLNRLAGEFSSLEQRDRLVEIERAQRAFAFLVPAHGAGETGLVEQYHEALTHNTPFC